MTADPPGEPGDRWSPQPGGALDLPGPAGGRGGRMVRAVPGRTETREDTYLVDPRLRGPSVKVRGGGALEVKVYRGSPGILDLAGRARGRMHAIFGGTAFVAAALAGLFFVVSPPSPAGRGRCRGPGHIARGNPLRVMPGDFSAATLAVRWPTLRTGAMANAVNRSTGPQPRSGPLITGTALAGAGTHLLSHRTLYQGDRSAAQGAGEDQVGTSQDRCRRLAERRLRSR
jgi:hypothetical protein